jgi:hypothetical protein
LVIESAEVNRLNNTRINGENSHRKVSIQ